MIVTFALVGCTREPAYLSVDGPTMGTYYRVAARCPSNQSDLRPLIEAELKAVNHQMSTYQQDSELSRFNGSEPGHWQLVSRELAEVVSAAARISKSSGGAFDVTVAPLVNLWGFGPEGRISRAPEDPAVEQAMAQVGFAHLHVDPDRPALQKDRPLTIDLSAIAKGHGVDRMSRLLGDLGCGDYLIDIGGEVYGRGVSPSGRLWRVGVEVPDPTKLGEVQRVLLLSDVAVATSGDYRNFLELDAGRVSHTLDPRTGHPVEHSLASVTVVHPSAMWADGLATALNVLGPEAGFELAERDGLAALFVIRRASGFEERYTPAILNYLDGAQ